MTPEELQAKIEMASHISTALSAALAPFNDREIDIEIAVCLAGVAAAYIGKGRVNARVPAADIICSLIQRGARESLT